MKFKVRTDIGGIAADLPAYRGLDQVAIDKPVVFLTGMNGCGKSSLLTMIRRTIGLRGTGVGAFSKLDICEHPYRTPYGKKTDLGRLAAMSQENEWSRDAKTTLIKGVPGVLDVVDLGWTGQRCYLHDTRAIDESVGHGGARGGIDLEGMVRASRAEKRSHGEVLRGRLRYALAWALGKIDIPDPYDRPPAKNGEWEYDRERYVRHCHQLFEEVVGHAPGGARPDERWLLLDEPENGIAPDVFAEHMAVLLDQAALGRLRVICASHSPLIEAGLGRHPNAQILDLHERAPALSRARSIVSSPEAMAAAARATIDQLDNDLQATLVRDAEALKTAGSGRRHVAAVLHDVQEIGLGLAAGASEADPSKWKDTSAPEPKAKRGKAPAQPVVADEDLEIISEGHPADSDDFPEDGEETPSP